MGKIYNPTEKAKAYAWSAVMGRITKEPGYLSRVLSYLPGSYPAVPANPGPWDTFAFREGAKRDVSALRDLEEVANLSGDYSLGDAIGHFAKEISATAKDDRDAYASNCKKCKALANHAYKTFWQEIEKRAALSENIPL